MYILVFAMKSKQIEDKNCKVNNQDEEGGDLEAVNGGARESEHGVIEMINAPVVVDSGNVDLENGNGEFNDMLGKRIQNCAPFELNEGKREREKPRILKVLDTKAVMYVPGLGVKSFVFNRVFNGEANQFNVYEEAAHRPIIAALNGFNACIICYGQTGSGKTHTMFGDTSIFLNGGISAENISKNMIDSIGREVETKETSKYGVAVRSLDEILSFAKKCNQNAEKSGLIVKVSLQYVEIYNNVIMDLLTGKTVDLRDKGVGEGAFQFVLSNAVGMTT